MDNNEITINWEPLPDSAYEGLGTSPSSLCSKKTPGLTSGHQPFLPLQETGVLKHSTTAEKDPRPPQEPAQGRETLIIHEEESRGGAAGTAFTSGGLSLRDPCGFDSATRNSFTVQVAEERSACF